MGVFGVKKKKVILDTNFLILPGSQGIDVYTQIPLAVSEPIVLVVVKQTLSELKLLLEGKSKEAFNAKLGYILAKQKGLKILSSSHRGADDAIVAQTTEGTYVATLDKELQRRVKEKGGRIITVRQGRVVLQR